MANGTTIPFAGVAQRGERLAHPGDAGSSPVPRSIEVNALRVSIDTGPLQIAFLAAATGTVVLLSGLIGYAIRGLL